mmetsp:Transcript_89887/g.253514  ORF Transcript_89887/g.253514 Transcript_89887/m.253514 type:complete len:352 (-) Transcript_89887:24-1079(-)
MREASQAVSLAIALCSPAVSEASAALEAVRPYCLGEDASDAWEPSGSLRGPAARLHDAMGSVAEASKLLAVTALDAAEAAAAAAPLGQGRRPQRAEEGVESDEETEEKSHHAGTPSAAEEANASENEDASSDSDDEVLRRCSHKARVVLEERKAVSTMLETVGMLRCTNRELLRLQGSARRLVEKEVGALPYVLAGVREHAFALVAEFLDQAALGFEARLERDMKRAETMPEHESEPPSSWDAWADSAVEESFAFLLQSDAELAVPLDLRGQALRAATAIDAEAVADMLESEVVQRLRGSLMSAMLDPRAWALVGLEPDIGDTVDIACEKISGTMLGAVERLQASMLRTDE